MVVDMITDNLGAFASILAGVGAANWLFIELFETDVVQLLSMGSDPLATLIYVLAGVAGLGAISSGVQMLDY